MAASDDWRGTPTNMPTRIGGRAVAADPATPAIPRAQPLIELGARPVVQVDFSTNHSVGRFELIRELGSGGMGQVFLGRDPKLGRRVAIKFMLRSDEHVVQQFLIEARATARCTHENIVTIFEVGEHEGLPYMVLEYLEGRTLSSVLLSKPSVRQFVELMVPVARALERAHEHGIVHRDLKPSNIFVTDHGQVKVLDFGVARLIDPGTELGRVTAMMEAAVGDEATVVRSVALVGTLPYMSPEQWGAAGVDARSDLWAFGIVLWQGLTGSHPIGNAMPELLRSMMCDLDTPLPSIATNASLPASLVAIVDRCLAKRKSERYQSARELLADLQAFLSPRLLAAASEVCPYRGLAAFTANDASYFFGRSNEIRTALAQLESWPMLVVIGPSGVGKSSFVHAGLAPSVCAAGHWQVRVLRPGRAPLERLAAVLVGRDESMHAHALTTRLVEWPGLFGAMLRQVANQRGERVLVIVDQLEELFTLNGDEEARRVFLSALLAAADDPSSPVRVVLSIRADFLDRLAAHKHVLAELSRGLFFLTAPDRDNLREALERPAELAGYAFEHPGIVEDMLQAATSCGALPLLSFAATRLWDARDPQRRLLTVAAYQQMGGVGGAFARHADQVASAVPPQSQRLLRAIMTRLVTPEGTRAVVDHRDLLLLGDEVERILDQLVRARLIHLHTDPHQAATVEIVHEMLITEWPTLERWLDDGHAIRGFVHELQQAAKQWDARGKPNDLVWRRATARDALAHAERHLLGLSALEREFLAAIKQQLARDRRRTVLVSTSVITAIGLALAGGAFGFVRVSLAEREAQDKAEQAAQALEQSEIDRALAIKAQGELQAKLDIIEAEKRKRETAEKNQQRSREQLAAAVDALEKKVAETEAATQKAQVNEALAKHASEEAKAAKRELEVLLGKKRAELEEMKKRTREISNRKL